MGSTTSIEVVLPEQTYQKLCQAAQQEHRSETEMVAEAVEAFLEQRTAPHPLLGLSAEEPDLIDSVEQEAMLSRETTPLRLHGVLDE